MKMRLQPAALRVGDTEMCAGAAFGVKRASLPAVCKPFAPFPDHGGIAMRKSIAAFTITFAITVVCCQASHAQNVIQVNATTNTGINNGNCEFKEAIQAAQTNLAVDGCTAGSAVNPDKIVFADA